MSTTPPNSFMGMLFFVPEQCSQCGQRDAGCVEAACGDRLCVSQVNGAPRASVTAGTGAELFVFPLYTVLLPNEGAATGTRRLPAPTRPPARRLPDPDRPQTRPIEMQT
jgi:hypothetical protein